MLKKHGKELSKMRLEITRKIDAVKKQFMNQEAEFLEPLNEELKKVQQLANDYATEQRRKEEEEQRKREEEERARIQREIEEQEKKDAEFREMFGDPATESAPVEPQPIQAPAVVEPERLQASNNARLVDVWEFEVVDQMKVPREYLVVDESKIRAYIKHQKSINNEPQLGRCSIHEIDQSPKPIRKKIMFNKAGTFPVEITQVIFAEAKFSQDPNAFDVCVEVKTEDGQMDWQRYEFLQRIRARQLRRQAPERNQHGASYIAGAAEWRPIPAWSFGRR